MFIYFTFHLCKFSYSYIWPFEENEFDTPVLDTKKTSMYEKQS